jgi:CRISPR-associated protein Cas2
MLKLCRRYLHWIQNSVFEGELTEAQLKEFKYEINELIKDNDSVIIFKFRQEKWVDKDILGKIKGDKDNIL